MDTELVEVLPRISEQPPANTISATPTNTVSTAPAASTSSGGFIAYLSDHWMVICVVLTLLLIGGLAVYMVSKNGEATDPKPKKAPPASASSVSSAQPATPATPAQPAATTTPATTQPATTTPAAPAATKDELDQLLTKAAQTAPNFDAEAMKLMDDGTETLVGNVGNVGNTTIESQPETPSESTCTALTTTGRKCRNPAKSDGKCRVHGG